MDKYEFNIKVEQIKKLVNKNDFATAMKIADTIDWRRVRNANLLSMISQVYEKNGEYQEAKEVLLLAFERAPISKRILYKLTELALKEGSLREAEDYYREFCDLAQDDPRQHLLRYMILKESGAPIDQLERSLERYTNLELDEKWLYELAELYDKAGKSQECIQLCDKLILMFGDGTYVERAKDLKQRYAPVTNYAAQRGTYGNYGQSQFVNNYTQENYGQPSASYGQETGGYYQPETGYEQEVQGYAVPQNSDMPGGQGYAVPQNSDMPGAAGYGAPQNLYGAEGYGVPGNDYMTETEGYAVPQGGFVPGREGYMAPQNDYVPDMERYAAPQNGYVPGTGSYEAPQNGYMPGTGNYSVPQNGYNSYAPNMQRYDWHGNYYTSDDGSYSRQETEYAQQDGGYEEQGNQGYGYRRNDYEQPDNLYMEENSTYGSAEDRSYMPEDEYDPYENGAYIQEDMGYGQDEPYMPDQSPAYRPQSNWNIPSAVPGVEEVDEELVANLHQAAAEKELAAEMSRISTENYMEPEFPSDQTKVFKEMSNIRHINTIRQKAMEMERENEKRYRERFYVPHHLMIEAKMPDVGFETAVEMLKKIHLETGVNNQVIKISGSKLSRKGIFNVSDKLAGKDLIVEEAGDLRQEDLEELQMLLERDETGMIVVLIDNPYQIEELHQQNPGFVNLFKCVNADEDEEEIPVEAPAEEPEEDNWHQAEEDDEPKEIIEEPDPTEPEALAESREEDSEEEIAEEEATPQEPEEEQAKEEEETGEEEIEDQYSGEEENEEEYEPEDEEEYDSEYDSEVEEEYEGEEPEQYEEEEYYEEAEPVDDEEMDLNEFAEYAANYAREIDCSITGKSKLALYERIEIMEEDGIPLTRANAEDLIEEAADKAEKPSLGGLIKGVFSSKYDKEGLLILKEEHFI